MVSAHKTDWDRKLASAIHVYNTSMKTTIGKTLYFMVFGQEAVHRIKLTLETYRIMAARLDTQVEDPAPRMLAIVDLEEGRAEALKRNRWIQVKLTHLAICVAGRMFALNIAFLRVSLKTPFLGLVLKLL